MGVNRTKCKVCKKFVTIEEYDPPKLCPLCRALYWDKPEVERTLHLYQDDFLESRDENIFTKMCLIFQEIIHNNIVAKLKGKVVAIQNEEIEDMVSETLVKLITYYRRDTFRITDSFNGYISQMVLNPLYNKPKKDREQKNVSISISINEGRKGGDKEVNLIDRIEAEGGKYGTEEWIMNEYQKKLQVKVLSEYIESIFVIATKEQGLYEAYKIITLLTFFLESRSERFFGSLWNVYSNETKNFYESCKYSMKDFIQDEIMMNNSTISEEQYDRMIEEYDRIKEKYIKNALCKNGSYYEKVMARQAENNSRDKA